MLWFVNANHFLVVKFIADVLSINCAGVFHNFIEVCSHLVYSYLLIVGEEDISQSCTQSFPFFGGYIGVSYSGLAYSDSSMSSVMASSSVTNCIILAGINYFSISCSGSSVLIPVSSVLVFRIFYCILSNSPVGLNPLG